MSDLNKAIEYLKNKYNLKNGFFCIYGSYATNTQNKNSDIDLLYIHRSNLSKLKRTSEKYKNIPISFYELSLKDLEDDSKGKYGGFFCGKLFNPSIIIDNTDKDETIVNKAIATYFSKLINEKFCISNKKYTSDEILKNSIRLYIELYPEYFSYIIRLIKNNEFEYIWSKWKEAHISILTQQNIIKKANNKYTYNDVYSKSHFESLKYDYISRFWIYGAVSHNDNLEFYDYYKNKNVDYILKNNKFKEETEKFLGITYMI